MGNDHGLVRLYKTLLYVANQPDMVIDADGITLRTPSSWGISRITSIGGDDAGYVLLDAGPDLD